MKKPVKTIRFSDHGQDFLEWDLAADGRVVACRPCQAAMWCQARVTNADSLRKGSIVLYRHPARDGALCDIRYPLTSVKSIPASQARAGGMRSKLSPDAS